MTSPTPQQVLALPIEPEEHGATTVREYLIALLRTLWAEEGNFSGKRPFGSSDWHYDLYIPLIDAGFVNGSFDEDGYVDELDETTADRLITEAIGYLGKPSVSLAALNELIDNRSHACAHCPPSDEPSWVMAPADVVEVVEHLGIEVTR
jgi:hypothetical protein